MIAVLAKLLIQHTNFWNSENEMEFSDWPSEALESFTSDLLALGLPGAEVEENAMLWNDYSWTVNTSHNPTTVEQFSLHLIRHSTTLYRL